MKNAMKKLMSLLLVAVLLVSAVPFAASAASDVPSDKIHVYYKTASGEAETWLGEITPADPENGAKVSSMVSQLLPNWTDSYSAITTAYSYDKNEDITADGRALPGDRIVVVLTPKTVDDSEHETQYYVNVIVKKDSVAQSAVQKEIQGSTTTVGNLIDYKINQDLSGYYFDHAYVNGKGTLGRDGVVDAGDTVEFAFYSVEETVEPITVYIKADSSNNVIAGPIYKEPDNGEYALVKNLLNYCWNSDWDNVYTFDHAWSETNNQTTSNSSAKIYAGDEVHIMLKTKTTTSTSTGSSSSSTTSKLNSNKVYLHIFVNNDLTEPAKNVDITNGIALDGKVTLDEVKTVVKNYYTAKTSDGIGYDGIYFATGNFAGNFVYDINKSTSITNVAELKEQGYVHMNVMITNATAKTTSTSTADSSNPKTGDSIYMPVAILGISASALAAVMFFYSKKRLAK